MQTLFNPDSKFMQFLSRIADLMMLNLCFILCSIPVFTIGASLTAMYTVVFRYDTDRENGTVGAFFTAFRQNFRQATVLWLLLLVCLVSAGFNTAFFYVVPGSMHWTWPLFAFLGVMALLICSYTFPLLSRFDNTCRATLRNALVMSIGYLPRSLVIAALNALPFVLLMTQLYAFLRVGYVWIFLYFSSAAYLNSKVLKKVFARYEEEDA